MRIQKVKIDKFKVLDGFEADLNGANIFLVGENGVGKSSVMQFIEIALGRTDNIPPDAIGKGEVVTDKDGNKYTFKVELTGGKPKVTVITQDGLKDTSKSAIKSIVGTIGFDVNEFVRLSETSEGRKEQVKLYKSLLSQEIIDEINRLEQKVQLAYTDRTEINRKIKTLDGFIKESPLYGHELKTDKVDVSELQEKLKAATEVNNKIEQVSERIVTRTSLIEKDGNEIAQLEAKIKMLREGIAENERLNTEASEWLKNNQKVDTETLRTKINNASTINSMADQSAELKVKMEQLANLQEQSQDYTVLIETSRQSISDAIKDMDSPINGLLFDDEGLVYNGIPVSAASLSTSEIIHLGIKIKMAQNPELGVLCVEHGESLGSARLKEILDVADKNNWQVIMEQVQRGQEELTIEFIGGDSESTPDTKQPTLF